MATNKGPFALIIARQILKNENLVHTLGRYEGEDLTVDCQPWDTNEGSYKKVENRKDGQNGHYWSIFFLEFSAVKAPCGTKSRY